MSANAQTIPVDAVYSCVTKYVRKHYGVLQEPDQEDIIQGTAENVFKALPSFDPSRGTFEKFLAFHIRTGASQAYNSCQTGAISASSWVRKHARAVQDDLDTGLTIDEVAEKRGLRKKTVIQYMRLTSRTVRLDAEDDDGNDLYERTVAEKGSVETGAEIFAEPDLSGFSEMEQFIIRIYIRNAQERAWKQKTLAECAKWGISKKKTMDAIRKVRKG